MKKILLALVAISFSFSSCQKDYPTDLPPCVKLWIEAVKRQRVWNPAAQVTAYRYKGETVYLLSADCCDKYLKLVDSNCDYICAPSGGFTGKGDGKCVDFNEDAELIKVVWKDDR